MKPAPFLPEVEQDPYVRDAQSGLVFHRAAGRVLYADTDRSDVVYHANYLRYFEYGRASLMREVAFPYAQVEAQGFVYPIIEMGLSFHAPLRYDDPFWVHTRPGVRDRVRIRFDYVITHAERGELVARGFTRHCALNARGLPVGVDPITVRTWEEFPI